MSMYNRISVLKNSSVLTHIKIGTNLSEPSSALADLWPSYGLCFWKSLEMRQMVLGLLYDAVRFYILSYILVIVQN